MDYPERSLDDWLEVLAAAGFQMKRTGAGRYAGPCPLCGGTDRFHLTDHGDKVLVNCRKCSDQPDWYRKLIRTLWPRVSTAGASNGRQKLARRRSAATSTSSRTEEDRQAMVHAARIWDKGVRADHTPGRIYLSKRRWVWPGPEVAGAPNLPQAVRWLTRPAALVHDPETGKPLLWLLEDAAGALLFAFTDAAGKVVAVQFEGLAATGKRIRKRFRGTHGRRDGAFLRLPPRGPRKPRVVLVEGPVDALAANWLYPNAVVLCCGGGLKPPADLPEGYAVKIEADGDSSGRTAAGKVRDALELKGIAVEVNWRAKGDLAEEWADTLRYERIEHAALMEMDGELTREEAKAASVKAWPPNRLWTPWIAGEGVPFFNQGTLNVEEMT